jgi:hypothetical protein
MAKIPIFLVSPIVLLLAYVYVIIPESDKVYDLYFFGFTDRDGIFRRQLVSKQAYVDYLGWRIVMILFHFTILSYLYRYRRQCRLYCFLWLGFLLDYIAIYNQPVFYYDLGIFLLPVSYSLIMGTVMTFTVILTITRQWKK